MQSQTYADLQSSSVDCMAPSACSSALVGFVPDKAKPEKKFNNVAKYDCRAYPSPYILDTIKISGAWATLESPVVDK